MITSDSISTWDTSRDGAKWTRDEYILALNLYFKLPFGKLNMGTPEVKELAKLLHRKAGSAAYRLTNFAACDPYILETGRHGNEAGRKQCQPYWDEFNENREALLFESEQVLAKLQGTSLEVKYSEALKSIEGLQGETRITEVKARVNQDVFRQIILMNYNCRCALTGIDIPELLVASHIKPWAKCKKERLNLENGICLSSLYDDCFDKGLIGFDNKYRVILSKRITDNYDKGYYDKHFGSINHQQLILPEEHKPNLQFLEWHMDEIFQR